jgi:hypothetical protein
MDSLTSGARKRETSSPRDQRLADPPTPNPGRKVLVR